tara:strand:+ start:4905 stop:6281 length:1377 start_codon:yes stop_codon:yes gene_type:complete
MSFHRSLFNSLLDWKSRERRKPLILRGARQVGKTTLVNQLGETYKHRIFLNLERRKDLSYFEMEDVSLILERLFLENGISLSSISETLLFIDEIQESPKAIHLLRYFYEEFPELPVIAAGSLLEFAIHQVKSFPVGRVEFLYLYPLNFPEFLKALKLDLLHEQIQKVPISKAAHHILLEKFHEYAIIGGMPEIVKEYSVSKSITELPRVYESIWGNYKNDVEKYANNETDRKVIKHIINTAHAYIDQRIKFQNFGNSTYRSREVGEAFRSLTDAKVIQIIYPTTNVQPPTISDVKKSPRLQFLDTGILNHSLNIQGQMLGKSDLCDTFNGAIIPHLVTQELQSLNKLSSYPPQFWVREKRQSSAEVDLIYTYQDKVIPIEIKSGSKGTLKSLHQFIERAGHPYAIRLYAGEFKIEKAKTNSGYEFFLMNLPYYLGTKIPEYVKLFVENDINQFDNVSI